MKLKNIVFPIIILIVGLVITLILLNLKSDPETKNPPPKRLSLATVVVDLSDITPKISAFGHVISAQPVQLISEVSGTIQSSGFDFRPAASFNKGDLLYKIDDRQMKMRINSSKSELLNALSQALPDIKAEFPNEYQPWEKYFNNCKFDQKLNTLPATENQKIKLYLSRRNVYKLYYSISDMEIDLEKYSYYAPFDGTVLSANLRAGSTVRSGSVIGNILNLDELEIELPLASSDIDDIDYDQSVSFSTSGSNQNWIGKISRVGRVIDDKTQTVPTYISVNENNESLPLLDGLFVEAIVAGKKIENGFVVPMKAIYDNHYVYLVSGGMLEYRKISIARKEANSVIVDHGLNNGDTLVVEALKGVAEGMPADARIITPNEIM